MKAFGILETFRVKITSDDMMQRWRVFSGPRNVHELIEKMEASEVFKGDLTDAQCKNLANYFVALPSEAVMKLWQALGNGNVDNVTRFHKSEADNGETVGGKLVTILTGK